MKIDRLRSAAKPLSDIVRDLDPLLAACGDSPFVLIGEASHGTHEFYEVRARITQRLIEERGFQAVVVEADWPDANRIHRYVRGESTDAAPEEALSTFDKFPEWMWGNTVIRDFVGWLRSWNNSLPSSDRKAGFYGMDLYSLYRSRAEVVRYLDSVDPEAARQARDRYACFDHFSENPESYGYTVAFGGRPSCESEALQQLIAIRSVDPQDGPSAEDAKFYAEQNARLVKNAEEYYRTMFAGRVSSWNLRDRHMADTIDALCDHIAGRGVRPKVVIWAHNSHLGDARATDMAKRGEWNVGQLMRERHPGETFLIGFTTYTGTVMAADDWGSPGHIKRVRPGTPGSYERLFHETGIPRFLLNLRETTMEGRLLERAIGVIYRPDTERYSHYFAADLRAQFDAVIHIDETHAVRPIRATHTEHDNAAERDTVPETFPTGV
ncbi:MAG TPA: erythromycin esterase family protein [Bryobacteraceae bacterium]|nr:erythromycin esterase family protein [Bryobacteraceae bacterium]